MRCFATIAVLFATFFTGQRVVQAQFDIVINPGAGLQSNQAALDAFERASQRWEAIFTDNITVNVDADFFSFTATGAGGPTVLGQASSSFVPVAFNQLRDELVADGVADGDGITAFLPTFEQLNINFPFPGSGTLSGNIAVNTANLKAIDEDNSLGLAVPGASDGTIEFNSDFGFDFDSTDGVFGIDFESVAAHEIGHVLGFVSELDVVEQAIFDPTFTVDLSPLDLFRFDDSSLPTTPLEFTNNDRSLVPGIAASLSDTVDTFGLSTGALLGDGNQASHFLDDAISGETLGLLDPTLTPGARLEISAADIRAFDLIGFNVNASAVPEPATLFAVVLGMIGLATRRTR